VLTCTGAANTPPTEARSATKIAPAAVAHATVSSSPLIDPKRSNPLAAMDATGVSLAHVAAGSQSGSTSGASVPTGLSEPPPSEASAAPASTPVLPSRGSAPSTGFVAASQFM
jgi:hypothetical protein